ncbi:MAG: hypothetical protein ABIL76_01875 [candidate division WOR-3 bacterium]
MITLILISQITREEFLEFKKYVEVQFTKTEEKFKAIETQIQTSNQKIEDLDKKLTQRIEDLDKKLNKRIDDLTTYLWIFMGFITILIGFTIGFGLKPVEEKKADKELVIKLEQKIQSLEDENKKLKNQNQALIFILEKFINGASKEEIKAEIELIKRMS